MGETPQIKRMMTTSNSERRTKTNKGVNMSDDILTTESISTALLKSVFDASYIDSTIDEDDELVVQDIIKVRIRISSSKDRIRLYSLFGFVPDTDMTTKLDCANKINQDYLFVCSSVNDNMLFFRYDIYLAGGLSKKGLIATVRKFASIPQDAVQDYGKDLIE